MTCDIDLSCPQPDNYAAIAKQLHETALEAEQRIDCLERLVRAAVNLPTAISLKTVDTDSYVASGEAIIFGSWNGGEYTVGFANSSLIISDETRYPAGIYQIGMFIEPYATGAVTANSIRACFVEVRETAGTGGFVRRADMYLLDPNNGLGNGMCLETVQRVDEGNLIHFKFYHENAASTMRIGVGTPGIAWITKLSDLNVTKVL